MAMTLFRAFSAWILQPISTWADGPRYYISRLWRWNSEFRQPLQRLGDAVSSLESVKRTTEHTYALSVNGLKHVD